MSVENTRPVLLLDELVPTAGVMLCLGVKSDVENLKTVDFRCLSALIHTQIDILLRYFIPVISVVPVSAFLSLPHCALMKL